MGWRGGMLRRRGAVLFLRGGGGQGTRSVSCLVLGSCLRKRTMKGWCPSPVIPDPSALLRGALFRYPTVGLTAAIAFGEPWSPEPVRGDAEGVVASGPA